MMTTDILLSAHFSSTQGAFEWNERSVGVKALGLSRLPIAWTPPFFVLPAAFHEEWFSRDASVDWADDAATWLERYPRLLDAIGELAVLQPGPVIVRSSSPLETLQQRGEYESVVSSATSSAISQAVVRIWQHSQLNPKASQLPIAAIVQAYAMPIVQGHLSNERRVSRRRVDWLCEILPHEEQIDDQDISPVQLRARIDLQIESKELACESRDDLNGRLTDIAAFALTFAQRCHIEWLWDGTRVWVVQADQEAVFTGRPPGSDWPASGEDLSRFEPAVFVPHAEARGTWHKIECLNTFHSCSLPEAQVFVLEDGDLLALLGEGLLPDDVADDLRVLTESPVVIRSDVKAPYGSEGFLLPRTDLCRNEADAALFLQETTQHFLLAGVPLGAFCFIVHRFIAARACALSLAIPNSPRVRIDATWGIPDGLLYYPHDSFEVDTTTGLYESRIRCKTEYLDVDSNGAWVQKRAGAPWDWRTSLTRDEIEAIGQHSVTLARHLDRAVETMFFVGAQSYGHEMSCLPWFYTDDVPPGGTYEAGEAMLSGSRLVSSVDDLAWADDALTRDPGRRKLAMRLRPTPDLLRSRDFIEKVAAVAARHGITVELEGSLLSHAYYLLRARDVRVRCVEPFESKVHRRRFGKLVRDLVPTTIRSGGEQVRSYRAARSELERLLRIKLIEEAFELFWADNAETTVEECADVLEVIEALSRIHDISSDDLRGLAETKRLRRGGFAEGIVLLETRSLPLLSPSVSPLKLFEVEDEVPKVGSIDSRPTRRGRRIVLPLVPPPPVNGVRSFTVRMAPDEELEVSYTSEGIIVTLHSEGEVAQHPVESQQVDGQLRLEGL